jgi:hypothetical protein
VRAPRPRHLRTARLTPPETFRQIQQQVAYELGELADAAGAPPPPAPTYALTSVLDFSAHLAFSRVVQRALGSLPALEELLNVFLAVRPFSRAARGRHG